MAVMVEKATNARFVVENRPGADGVVAANHFVALPPDGHSIMMASQQGIFVLADLVNPGIPRFNNDSFDYVLNIARSPLAIVVPQSSSINSTQDLIKYTRSGEASTFAVGSSAHKLAFEYLVNAVRADRGRVTAISYKGPAQAGQDVMGQQVSAGIIPAAVAYSLIKSNKMRFVAILGEKPLAAIAQVPTMESLVPGLSVYAGWGIVLPKNSPPAAVSWYQEHFGRAVRSEQAQQFFHENLMEYNEQELTPAGYKQSMESLRKKWYPIAQRMFAAQGQ
jgi:tripartite-type tricarboxylate transporter receptor subunit TctC